MMYFIQTTFGTAVCIFIIFSFSYASPISTRDINQLKSEINNVTENEVSNSSNVCVTDDVVYKEGDNIPGAGPCETCHCGSSGITCSMIKCDVKTSCKVIQQPQQCCPTYTCDCNYDGKVYNNGDKIQINGSSCQICYCKGGDVACTNITCYRREGCPGKYVPNMCCPTYDHCPPLENISEKKKLNFPRIDRNSYKRNLQNPSISESSITTQESTSIYYEPIDFNTKINVRNFTNESQNFKFKDTKNSNKVIRKEITTELNQESITMKEFIEKNISTPEGTTNDPKNQIENESFSTIYSILKQLNSSIDLDEVFLMKNDEKSTMRGNTDNKLEMTTLQNVESSPNYMTENSSRFELSTYESEGNTGTEFSLANSANIEHATSDPEMVIGSTSNPEKIIESTSAPETLNKPTLDAEKPIESTEDPEKEIGSTNNPESLNKSTLEKFIETASGLEKVIESTTDREKVIESTTDPESLNKFTRDPEKFIESATDPERVIESTSSTEKFVESTTNPEKLIDSTSDPESLNKSTFDPEKFIQSSTNSEKIIQSTSDPKTIIESTSGPDSWNKSTTDSEKFVESTTGDVEKFTESTTTLEKEIESTTDLEKVNKSTSVPEKFIKSTTDPETIIESTNGPESWNKSTSVPEKFIEPTTDPERIIESTSDPEKFVEFISKLEKFVESITDQERIIESINDPMSLNRSTTDPERIIESTTNLERVFESTTDPERLIGSTNYLLSSNATEEGELSPDKFNKTSAVPESASLATNNTDTQKEKDGYSTDKSPEINTVAFGGDTIDVDVKKQEATSNSSANSKFVEYKPTDSDLVSGSTSIDFLTQKLQFENLLQPLEFINFQLSQTTIHEPLSDPSTEVPSISDPLTLSMNFEQQQSKEPLPVNGTDLSGGSPIQSTEKLSQFESIIQSSEPSSEVNTDSIPLNIPSQSQPMEFATKTEFDPLIESPQFEPQLQPIKTNAESVKPVLTTSQHNLFLPTESINETESNQPGESTQLNLLAQTSTVEPLLQFTGNDSDSSSSDSITQSPHTSDPQSVYSESMRSNSQLLFIGNNSDLNLPDSSAIIPSDNLLKTKNTPESNSSPTIADIETTTTNIKEYREEKVAGTSAKIEKRVYDPLMPYPDTYPDEFQTIQNGPALIITKTTYTRIPDVTYTTVTTATLPTFKLLKKAEDAFANTLLDTGRNLKEVVTENVTEICKNCNNSSTEIEEHARDKRDDREITNAYVARTNNRRTNGPSSTGNKIPLPELDDKDLPIVKEFFNKNI